LQQFDELEDLQHRLMGSLGSMASALIEKHRNLLISASAGIWRKVAGASKRRGKSNSPCERPLLGARLLRKGGRNGFGEISPLEIGGGVCVM
jgi:hypothetical protein